MVPDARRSDPPSFGAVAPASPKVPTPAPVPEAPDRIGRKGTKPAETATVIGFAGPVPSRREQPDGIQVLPEIASDEARIRVALATMALDLVQLLERHETFLDRYGHMLELYLDPEGFLDLTGLNEDETSRTIASTWKLALSVLLPAEQDTLDPLLTAAWLCSDPGSDRGRAATDG